jgi:hypothetical protein
MTGAVIFILILNLWGCDAKPVIDSVAVDSVFSSPVRIGTLTGADMTEASGIVASVQHPGMWWIINDSGHAPIIFLVDSTGRAAAHYRIDGVTNRDWEDLSMRIHPVTRKAELLIAEIGDNRAVYGVKHIYAVDEPSNIQFNLAAAPEPIPARVYSFVYPDGDRDAETLMVDPMDHSWYIVSKREEEVRLYQFNPDYIERMDLAYSQGAGHSSNVETSTVDTLRFHLTLPFTGATAGDISFDGSEILIKSYIQVFYWRRDNNSISLPNLLTQEGRPQPYIPETQGESIAFGRKSHSGYITVSEKSSASDQPFLYYPRLKD